MTHSEIEIDCNCFDILNVLESGQILEEIRIGQHAQAHDGAGGSLSDISFGGDMAGGYSIG